MCKYSDKMIIILATCILSIFIAGCSIGNKVIATQNPSEVISAHTVTPPAQQVPESVYSVYKSTYDSVKSNVYVSPTELKPYYNGDRAKKLIAITFDDGPDRKNTPAVLDILKKYKVKATFFLVGRQVAHFPEVAKRIVEEGHSVGNHTYNHIMLTKDNPKQVQTELMGTETAIHNATGIYTNLFRPPFGRTSKAVLNQISKMGFKEIMWDIDPNDWRRPPIAKMVNYELNHVKNGSIILNHSGEGEKLEATIKSLPWIITELRSKGYEFVTIPELIYGR